MTASNIPHRQGIARRFLIALAIFVPLNFAATLIGLFAGQAAGGVVSAAVALVVLPGLVQVAIYRARAYRLSRTRYRGIASIRPVLPGASSRPQPNGLR